MSNGEIEENSERTTCSGTLTMDDDSGKIFSTDDEIILKVDKALTTLSLGFSLDAGGTLLKLVYRSKEDYENGKPKDAELPYGKLRLRLMKSNDVEALLKFLLENCDIMEDSRKKSKEDPDKQFLWYQTGCCCQFWMKVMDERLQVRSAVVGESDIHGKGIRGFYSKSTFSSFYQRLLPLSTQAVNVARKMTVAKKKSMDFLESLGEKSYSAMMNRAPPGVDLHEYRTKLENIDAEKLTAEMSLKEIEYPSIILVIGSAMSMFLLGEDNSTLALDLLPLSAKAFDNIGYKLTGAKDHQELVQMIKRGDARKIHCMAGDTKFKDRTSDDWYNLWDDDLLIFAFGKLCNTTCQNSYSNDDIAAAWALSFCMNTAKLLALYSVIHHAKSVLISGSFINTPVLRNCLEECFMTNSLAHPFAGAQVVKMASLPNPGFVGALGTWMHNLEREQAIR